MKPWEIDKRWSDRFLPEIKRHLGEHLIGEPPVEEDTERNTDLMVLKMDAVRISCRIRKHFYLEKYADEFTIRSGRPSNVETELTKIIRGWGDYFFYGFCNENETHLAQWFIGDFKAFRIWHSRCLVSGIMPGNGLSNHDNSSTFRSFKVKDIPGFIVASNWLNDPLNQDHQTCTIVPLSGHLPIPL